MLTSYLLSVTLGIPQKHGRVTHVSRPTAKGSLEDVDVVLAERDVGHGLLHVVLHRVVPLAARRFYAPAARGRSARFLDVCGTRLLAVYPSALRCPASCQGSQRCRTQTPTWGWSILQGSCPLRPAPTPFQPPSQVPPHHAACSHALRVQGAHGAVEWDLVANHSGVQVQVHEVVGAEAETTVHLSNHILQYQARVGSWWVGRVGGCQRAPLCRCLSGCPACLCTQAASSLTAVLLELHRRYVDGVLAAAS